MPPTNVASQPADIHKISNGTDELSLLSQCLEYRISRKVCDSLQHGSSEVKLLITQQALDQSLLCGMRLAATAEREAHEVAQKAEKLRSEVQASDSASHSEDEVIDAKARGRPPLGLQMTSGSSEDVDNDTR